MKKINTSLVEKILVILSILFIAVLWLSKSYWSNVVAAMVLIIDFYMVFKVIKNTLIFFLFMTIAYFDYSVIFSKYFFRIENFDWIFKLIKYNDTLFVGIAIVFILHSIILFFMKKEIYTDKKQIFEMTSEEKKFNNKYCKLIMSFLIAIIAFVVFDYFFFHIIFNKETIYEYLLIPIIIVIYYCRDNKLFRRMILLIIVFSAAINIYRGGRIASLCPLIAYFFIIYYKKINYKIVSFVMIVGILFYVFFGMYGDILIHNGDVTKLSVFDLSDRISEDMLTLDTSYSAYWTGLTMVESRNIVKPVERIKNMIHFFSTYTIFGTLSNYEQVSNITHNYYTHWYGGYITGYFYYWLGIIGVILISLYLSYLLYKFASVNTNSSNYIKILLVYFICTVPRWYLYYPTGLFRGVLIYTVVYYVINVILQKKIKIRW